ncbi:MAG: Ethyl tert-butyl ether degradation EthD [Ilumatobacteraceae bacterium]|jgi:uncharacterized protein (TIGR02118 family)|nr:Ethyl tert-butyl ether degradation EthD [Ilumatobacteraceae bacterium]
MIRVSVYYPAGEGTTFDLDYYKAKHAEIVMRVLGCDKFEIDKAISGPNMAVGHLYFSSMDALQAGMAGADAGEAAADVINFTNVEPVIQIAELVG